MQEIVRLPENAIITAPEYDLHIENHEVVDTWTLLFWVKKVFRNNALETVLPQLKKHGISFEAVIEYCVTELEEQNTLRENIVSWHFNVYMEIEYDDKNSKIKYETSQETLQIREQIIEEMRNCSDWDDLRRSFNEESRFSKDMKEQIKKQMTVWFITSPGKMIMADPNMKPAEQE